MNFINTLPADMQLERRMAILSKFPKTIAHIQAIFDRMDADTEYKDTYGDNKSGWGVDFYHAFESMGANASAVKELINAIYFTNDVDNFEKGLPNPPRFLDKWGEKPLTIGDKVCKPKGYPFDGTIVAAFDTLAGERRFVVDNGYGMLHIFNENNLQKV